MRMITRKKPAFTELYQTGVLTRIAAVKSPDGGGWRLGEVYSCVCGGCSRRDSGVVWSGLDYPAYFYASCGISLWEVHNKLAEKAPE